MLSFVLDFLGVLALKSYQLVLEPHGTLGGGESFPPVNLENNAKETNKSKTRSNRDSLGPFNIYVEHEVKNIGNYHPLSIARDIYNQKVDGILKIERKGKNGVCIVFKSSISANSFVIYLYNYIHNILVNRFINASSPVSARTLSLLVSCQPNMLQFSLLN